jgi:hypothetical protein
MKEIIHHYCCLSQLSALKGLAKEGYTKVEAASNCSIYTLNEWKAKKERSESFEYPAKQVSSPTTIKRSPAVGALFVGMTVMNTVSIELFAPRESRALNVKESSPVKFSGFVNTIVEVVYKQL